ncbi:hypothetical protein KP509_23G008400 [Ceratopteris richardii]|uniref:PDZ domain-containing protein n=1 Tax=Ceratopteris richardii TaxID=49495 RepID=A0A8T2RZM7_CERRI|nr:hypothetical protein KP509_23G008400 [Ceratopteris richardii]KAH7301025.1 hypothetical protein KP509_23G008400 [Ceratopteris richardii]
MELLNTRSPTCPCYRLNNPYRHRRYEGLLYRHGKVLRQAAQHIRYTSLCTRVFCGVRSSAEGPPLTEDVKAVNAFFQPTGEPFPLRRHIIRTVPEQVSETFKSSLPLVRRFLGFFRGLSCFVDTLNGAVMAPCNLIRSSKKFLDAATSLALALAILGSGLNAHAFVVPTARRLQSDELATVQLFRENTPSVVYITNLAVRRDAFTLDVMEVPQGSGSGFLWDKKGHVVTNYHVIRGASDLRVTLGDQSVYEADVVGYDEDKDVAVLHIDAPEEKIRPIPVGTSSDLLVGQKVYAIGNPFGLDHTLTTGVISGLRREISSAATGRPIQDVIQTDAAINPGNSGGPLLDSSGNLIGINTAIYSPSGASSGVGFSIPVDTVSGIVDQIIKYGKVTRPVLGISFAPEQSVEQLGVSGVLVLDAPPGGPAGKAGLRPTSRDEYGRLVLGDIITSLNGQKVSNGSDLYKILDRCKVGDEVMVEVLRGDKKMKIPVTLEARD